MARLVKKFDTLMEVSDYEKLLQLSAHYGLSMAAIIRLALRDLHQKLQTTETRRGSYELNPVLQPAADAPPPEMDDFWKDFRR